MVGIWYDGVVSEVAVSWPEQAPLLELPGLPGRALGKRLRILDQGGRRAILVGDRPLHVYDLEDKLAENACIVLLGSGKLASHLDLAQAFGRHRNTVSRLCLGAERQGMAAVLGRKRGPKGPRKLTPEAAGVVARQAELGCVELAAKIEQETGLRLSVSYVSRLRQRYLSGLEQSRVEQLCMSESGVVSEPQPLETQSLDGESATSQPEAAGTAMVIDEAMEGEVGELADAGVDPRSEVEPLAVVPELARGRYMGSALYYPALEVLGLLEAAGSCFRLPDCERFGVRATTLTLFFLALLSQTTVEAAKHLRRFEFGPVIGAGRAPSVKTLRRKLSELAAQDGADLFQQLLARRWVEQALLASAYLYVDGHVKAYSGKRKLSEVWNSKRRMPLAGVLTHFVNDGQGRPLLFVTEEANLSLARAMPKLVEEIRKVLGDRQFTVIFDRGGYEAQLFSWLRAQGIDFITYQRGDPKLAQERFRRQECRFEGKVVRLQIAEDKVEVGASGPFRRITVRTPNGHQTPILTSLTELPAVKVALLIFARWRQENFFKYMGEHMGLDQLLGYSYQEADGGQLVPNPKRREADQELKAKRGQLAKLRSDLGKAVLGEAADFDPKAKGPGIAQPGLIEQIRQLEAKITALLAQRSTLPSHVPLEQVGQRELMRLEHKAIIDRVKMTAYNAEEWLLERLAPHYPNCHDIRLLLRSFAQISGEIRSTAKGVVVTLDPPDIPQQRRALRGLCADLTQLSATFPGTDLPVSYQVAVHHSEKAA